MKDGPSRTALAAGFHRADHQQLEGGLLFKDPLAVRIVEGLNRDGSLLDGKPGSRGMRLFVAGRSRFAEDCLSEAIAQRGVRQVLILGAGLDTFAFRQNFPGIRVFEVDHPATQEWKRSVLSNASIALPKSMTFVPVDFERDELLQELLSAEFAVDVPTFAVLLGVVCYLTKSAFDQTLRLLGTLSHCEIALDYPEPPLDLEPPSRALHVDLAERTAAAGEPHISYFSPAEMEGTLAARAFREREDLDVFEMLLRYLGREVMGHSDASPPARGGAHVVHAVTAPTG